VSVVPLAVSLHLTIDHRKKYGNLASSRPSCCPVCRGVAFLVMTSKRERESARAREREGERKVREGEISGGME